MQVFRRDGGGQFVHIPLLQLRRNRGAGQRLAQRHLVQQRDDVLQQRLKVHRLAVRQFNQFKQFFGVARGDAAAHVGNLLARGQPQHRFHLAAFQPAVAVGDGLVEQAQRVAHAALGGDRNLAERAVVVRDVLGVEQRGEVFVYQPVGQARQVELQAARQDCHRDFARVRRREEELHMFGRLLQRFQQRVETVDRQHVHLVNQVDLEAPGAGGVLHIVEQFAHVVHAGARRRVHLDQVNEVAGVHLAAGGAFAARRGADALFAVEAFGEDARDGGLADAARAGEQVGVVQAAHFQRVFQRADDMALADDLLEVARAPFARQYLVTHRAVRCGLVASPPQQRFSGTREDCYRCFLPNLAGLAVPRCKGAAAKGRRYYARFGRQKHAARRPPPGANGLRGVGAGGGGAMAPNRAHFPFVRQGPPFVGWRVCYTPHKRKLLFSSTSERSKP